MMSSEESMGTSDEEEEKQPATSGNVIKDILQKFSIDKAKLKIGKSSESKNIQEISSPGLRQEEEEFYEVINEDILDDVEYNAGSSLDKAQLYLEDF